MTSPESSLAEAEEVSNAHITEHTNTHLSDREHALLKELLRPGVSIEAVIPDDADAEDLWRTLDACVRGLGLLEARICRLKPIIGRILLVFERKPSLYKSLGYEDYSTFMRKGVYDTLGLHRTSAYEGKLVARDWPQLSPDRYAEIGPKRLNILSKITSGRSSNAEAWLDAAKRMKVGEFREYAEQRGFIEKGETVGATITIQTNRSIFKQYRECFGDGRVHSVVGSKDHGDILQAMIQACFGEWVSQYEERRRLQNETTPDISA